MNSRSQCSPIRTERAVQLFLLLSNLDRAGLKRFSHFFAEIMGNEEKGRLLVLIARNENGELIPFTFELLKESKMELFLCPACKE